MEEIFVFSNQWEFFPCQIDNMRHSIRFDMAVLGLDAAAKAAYPHTLVLTVFADETADDGMPTPEAFTTLNSIEDGFSAAGYKMRYVGAITGNGRMRFVFCCASDAGEAMAAALLAGNGAEYEYEMKANDNFGYFSRILTPDKYEMNWIMNRRVCAAMEETGEAFAEARDIDFYIHFTKEQDAENIAGKMTARGFVRHNLEKMEDGGFSLHLTLNDIPEFNRMNQICGDILEDMDGIDGYFDGWGAPTCQSAN